MLAAVSVAIPVSVGGIGPVAAARPAMADPDSMRGVWQAPAEVNRTPIGQPATGPWKYATSGAPAGSTSDARLAGPDDDVPKPGLGVQDFYGMEGIGLSDEVGLGVNLANGNLVTRVTGFGINGPGIAVSLDSFYNGLASRSGSLGPRWSLTGGQDVGLEIAPEKVIFRAQSGFRAAFTKDGDGWKAPSGLDAELTESDGTWTLRTRGSGQKLTFTSGGYLSTQEDRNGNKLTWRYDAANRATSVTDVVGRVICFEYTEGLLTKISDPANRHYTYNFEQGRLAQTTNFKGESNRFRYDSAGRLTSVRTARGTVTAISYDSSNRVTKISRFLTLGANSGDAAVTSFSYAEGETKQTDPNEHTSTYTIDDSGRVTDTKDPLGRTRSQTWTTNSTIATATDSTGSGGGVGNVTSFTYDSANNPIQVSAPTGAAATAQYAGGTEGCASSTTAHPDLPKCATDTQGSKSAIEYDGAGNVVSVRDVTDGPTGGAEEKIKRQGDDGVDCGAKNGQVCSTEDAEGRTTTYGYGKDATVTSVTHPGPLGRNTATYDSLSRLETATDGNGRKTTYYYDALDRFKRIVFHDGRDVQYEYDADGNIQISVDNAPDAATPNNTYFTYDALNRQTSVRPANTNTPLKVTLDKVGNTLTATSPAGTTKYTYDEANQLTSVAEPGHSCPAEGPAAGCSRYEYDDNGNRTTVRYPGGTVQQTSYDGSNRITRIRSTNGEKVFSDLSYSYRASGTTGYNPVPGNEAKDSGVVTSRTDHRGVGAPAGTVTTYSYDSLDRLRSAEEDGASWAWTFDKVGNRKSQTLSGGTGQPGGTTSYSYDDADELIGIGDAKPAYDRQGNETAAPGLPELGIPNRTSEYNVRNQLGAITTTASGGTSSKLKFHYNGIGNNERLVAGPSKFLAGMLGTVRVTTGYSSDDYVRLPDGSLVAQRSSRGTFYYLTDNLGSVVGLVDGSGAEQATYAYGPYGTQRHVGGNAAGSTVNADANPYRYIGGWLDFPTGLYKLGWRYYDPSTGRFTQPDPSGQEKHAYLYSAGDPINRADPTGLWYGGISGSACILACVELGVGWDGDPDLTIGFAAGPEIGLGAQVGGGYGDNEGWEVKGSCQGSVGPVGVYGEVSVGEGADLGGGGGWAPGASLGCSAGASYTF
jgi:RHS repeat-associated protein